MHKKLLSDIKLPLWIVATSLSFLAPPWLFCDDRGQWFKEAVDLAYSVGNLEKPGARQLSIDSPDHKKQVIIQDAEFQVLQEGKILGGTCKQGIATLAELGWSPDSKGFFVTWSDGGDVGTWSFAIYLLNKQQVVKLAPAQEVISDFMKRYKCSVWGDHQGNDFPNLAALKWANGSKELLLIAEVPPHSTCPQMGKFIGYLISVPEGKILERISSQDMKKRWGDSLGSRHRDDEGYDTSTDKLSAWSSK